MHVINRGEIVGTLSDLVPDMWYLSGKFAVADTANGNRFLSAVSKLAIQTTYGDHSKAIRATLRESMDDPGTVFVVMSLQEGDLFGRRVFEQDAVNWVLKNVPE